MGSGVLKLFQGVLIYSTPLALLVLLDGQLWPSFIPLGAIGNGFINTVSGILFIFWILSLLVFLTRILWSAEYRGSCFTNLAGIRERDEREELIVGRAAKSSFLFMLSVLLILFFISTWRYGERPSAGDASKSLTLGHLDLTERSSVRDLHSDTIYYPIPVSKTALLMLVISLQLLSFRYFSRTTEKNI